MTVDLTRAETHFAFGRNWADYAESITESKIGEAESALQRLVGDLTGKRILDIGCGSGLHALAALQLGATEVLAVDLDVDSVATTDAVLRRFAGQRSWRAQQISVFELEPARLGHYDVVYSWGCCTTRATCTGRSGRQPP